MAGVTIRRGQRIIAAGMAVGAIIDIMCIDQREKIMIDFVSGPAEPVDIMTFTTVCREAGFHVIGICGRHVVTKMAINTIITDPFES